LLRAGSVLVISWWRRIKRGDSPVVWGTYQEAAQVLAGP